MSPNFTSRAVQSVLNMEQNGLRAKVESEIKRLCAECVLVAVTRRKWASPFVVVNPGDGSITLCVNCKKIR